MCPLQLIHRSLYKSSPRVNSFIQQITVLSTSGSGLGARNKVVDKTDFVPHMELRDKNQVKIQINVVTNF